MQSLLRIGDLSREAGVPTSTVRYYEREGLLAPEGRSDANYRLYGDRALVRLRFIRSAQAAGFTLSDIKSLLKLKDGNTTRCSEVKAVIEQRLAGIEERINDLRQMERMLKSFLKICQRSQAADSCEVIDKLDS